METLIGEKIKVVSLFESGKMRPILFEWQKRVYNVLKVDFTYSKDVGKEKVWYFSVETEGGMFELSLNREKFSWELTRVLDSN